MQTLNQRFDIDLDVIIFVTVLFISSWHKFFPFENLFHKLPLDSEKPRFKTCLLWLSWYTLGCLWNTDENEFIGCKAVAGTF